MRRHRRAVDQDRAEGERWREIGLRTALANMPSDSPGRAVVEALLARGTLTEEEGRQFKAMGLRAALSNMPADSPGRTVVQALLARESEREPKSPTANREDPLDRLERLASLRERGHLTDEEFEAAKRKLVN